MKLERLRIRAYGVGFGDCFLLTFFYTSGEQRHMLIDFGSTERPNQDMTAADLKQKIAADIQQTCGAKLAVVVATHRHADHINGFEGESGQILSEIGADLVVMPWTEDPDAPKDWNGDPGTLADEGNSAFRAALSAMEIAAGAAATEFERLEFDLLLAKDQISNKAALATLQSMGAKTVYVKYGDEDLLSVLDDVKIRILGPPTIAQKAGIRKQRPKHPEEFWLFAGFWLNHAAAHDKLVARKESLFPDHEIRDYIPVESEWLVDRIKQVRAQQLFRIVTAMNDALNNTSIILLIEALGKKFLFPGDAQWENWEWAFQHHKDELAEVSVYKVGHHGSLNATPKSVWKEMTRNGSRPKSELTSLLSTKTDSKHGDKDKSTEVPRTTLLEALSAGSRLVSTQALEGGGELFVDVEFSL